MNMKQEKVYIVLTDTRSILSQFIKLYTRKRYNHVSISFDAELQDIYSFGRKKVGNPFKGGFIKENMREGLYQHADCIIYSLSVTKQQLQYLKNKIQVMKKQKEIYRYHILGLFGFFINKPIYRKNAYFCSQFVATLLDTCNAIQFEKPLALITPSDFEQFNQLQLLYEGDLQSYLQQYEENQVSLSSYAVS